MLIHRLQAILRLRLISNSWIAEVDEVGSKTANWEFGHGREDEGGHQGEEEVTFMGGMDGRNTQ